MDNKGPRKFTLGKEERLKSRKLIERVFKEGKSFALFPFRVYYAPLPAGRLVGAGIPGGPGDAGGPGRSGGAGKPGNSGRPGRSEKPGKKIFLQAGFGAGSRNFKKAVDRNRIKRLTREAYRLQKQVLQDYLEDKGLTLAVFFIYVGKELPDQELVRGKIALILQKLVRESGT